MNANAAKNYTPPLGHAALTPLYDAAIALLTRERVWRRAIVAEILAARHDTIVDVGSGTGSLAILLHNAAPNTIYVGVDPDGEAVIRARSKAARAGSVAKFLEGFFPDVFAGEPVDLIVSSLVLHQVPLAEKNRIIAAAFGRLKPGGKLILADYGLQDTALARCLFRMTVQTLDGRENTQSNADGVLPRILQEAGFEPIRQKMRLLTPTGLIHLYNADRPA